MPSLSNARLSRISLLVAFAAAVAACTGGTTNSPLPQNGMHAAIPARNPSRHVLRKAYAVVAIPLHYLRTDRRAQAVVQHPFVSSPIADEALQIGNREHFLRLAAQVMHRILVDRARARLSAKRGGDLVRGARVRSGGGPPRPGGGKLGAGRPPSSAPGRCLARGDDSRPDLEGAGRGRRRVP